MNGIDNCILCNHNCKMIPSQLMDTVFTKECQFVKLLEFETTVFRRIKGGQAQISQAVFSDLISRSKDTKVQYICSFNGAIDKLHEGEPIIVDAEKLIERLPEKNPEKRIRQITNLSNYFKNNPIVINIEDRGLCNSLMVGRNYKMIADEIEILNTYGYLSPLPGNNRFIISESGYNAINTAKHKNESDTIFIALSFDPANDAIIDAISEAVENVGYRPIVMKNHHHNNNIVMEILDQIGKSRCLICDLSIPNHGAYFEAGYAMGIGHEIVLTCVKDTFENKDKNLRPHFDIAQFSMIIWEDINDLKNKLEIHLKETINP